MAKSDAVWGIDIGQCALKALRCRPHADADKVTADAFDFIEYPKILSQPEANPAELVAEALKEFLSRNSVRGDRVAICVPGQSGLARFIKLPPVESKKIPDIVKYEAKQQIPFALEDVVWDYQQMAGGSEEDGFALETEVGLFAMKRDQVFRAMKPLDEAGVEIDFVQLTPLALYNYLAFDQMQDLPPPDEFDPENPPESVLVLSLGTDTADLVVSNGYRVWQRSIPIGGNHFTRALTKELKLTFATAEHLKRNATAAEDPKALFQAMRPVFNDLLTEVQRSISYFQNVDRTAKIGRALVLGNAMKLPGLQRYLQQNLGIEVEGVKAFRGLTGPGVVDAPAFKDNAPAFGVSYGLALQGLRPTRIRTNLIPPEIVQERMVRAKKPWAIAAAALLMLGCTVSFASYWSATRSVSLETDHFGAAISTADQTVRTAQQVDSDYEQAKQQFLNTRTVARNIVRKVEGRELWLELLRAVNAAMPRDPAESRPEDIAERNELHIEQIESTPVADVATWYTWVTEKKWYVPKTPEAPASAEGAEAVAPPATVDPAAQPAAGPSGPGWIIQIAGYHFHNKDRQNQGVEFVRNTLIESLEQPELPIARPGGGVTTIPVAKLGVQCPTIIAPPPIDWRHRIPDPNAEETDPATGRPISQPMRRGPGGAAQTAGTIEMPRFDFVVQFIWQEVTPSERDEQPAGDADPVASVPGSQR